MIEINIIKDLNAKWLKFCEKRKWSYLFKFLPKNRLYRRLIKKPIFQIGKLRNTDKLLRILNFLRCAAHRDLAIESLKRIIYIDEE